MAVSFKRLDSSDMPLLMEWINQPHVQQYYYNDYNSNQYSFQETVNEFDPSFLISQHLNPYIIEFDKKPIGYIQKYVFDEPCYGMDVPWENTGGFDLFIGDPNYINKGIGFDVLFKFLNEEIFVGSTVTCVINPRFDNERAIRLYEKLGFKKIKTIDFQSILKLEKEDLRSRPRYIEDVVKIRPSLELK